MTIELIREGWLGYYERVIAPFPHRDEIGPQAEVAFFCGAEYLFKILSRCRSDVREEIIAAVINELDRFENLVLAADSKPPTDSLQ